MDGRGKVGGREGGSDGGGEVGRWKDHVKRKHAV